MSDDLGKLDSIDEPIDRGHLASDKKKGKNKLVGAILLIAALILLFVLYKIFAGGSNSAEAGDLTTAVQTSNDLTSHQYDSNSMGSFFDEAKRRLEAKKAAKREKEREAKQVVAESKAEPKPKVQKPIKTVSVRHSSPQVHKPTITDRRMSGNVTVAIDGQQSGRSQSSVSSSGSLFGGGSTGKANNTYDVAEFDAGAAVYRKNRDFLLIHGTTIPCALKTEIISDYQGIVQCMVTSDVYSANGAALLIERGSMLQGTQSVEMEAGKSRVFTTWHDIETPDGVSVVINSLGTGATGASGSEAWIDNHFMQRFGGAIMLSFIDDALATVAANAQPDKTGVQISTDNTSDNASKMASIALENSINIKPTGYVPIGTRLNVILARDIDMSSVYSWK